jgi:hypothetical protein
VTAHVMVLEQGENAAKPEIIVFTLRREHGAWKIDDIADPAMPSIRTYFYVRESSLFKCQKYLRRYSIASAALSSAH